MRKLWMLGGGMTLLLATFQSSSVSQDFFDRNGRDRFYRARLTGFQEVPTLGSPARGEFVARVGRDEISYRLSYSGLPTPVLFAHIHMGATGTNGGIAAFLCGGAPPQSNKPPCPSPGGVVTGIIVASDVIGPTAQGIGTGEFHNVLSALRNNVVYANVHTERFPAGEIRGQVLSDDDD